MEIEELNLSKKLDSLVWDWLDFEDENVEDFILDMPDIVTYSQVLPVMDDLNIPINYYIFLAPFLEGDEKESGKQQRIIFMEERQYHPIIEFKRCQKELLSLRKDLMDIVSMIGRVAFWEM